VRVLLQCERGRLVSQALAAHLQGYAGLDCERRVRMAEVVQPDSAEARVLDQPLERLAEAVRVDRPAVLLGHHEILLGVVRAPSSTLELLRGVVRAELLDGPGIEVDDARLVTLRCRIQDDVGDGDNRLADGEPHAFQIDVLPSKTERLASAHPGHGGETPGRSEARVLRVIQKSCEFLGLPSSGTSWSTSGGTQTGIVARSGMVGSRPGAKPRSPGPSSSTTYTPARTSRRIG